MAAYSDIGHCHIRKFLEDSVREMHAASRLPTAELSPRVVCTESHFDSEAAFVYNPGSHRHSMLKVTIVIAVGLPGS